MLNIPINQEKEYTLPIQTLTDDMEVIHLSPLPQYASFEFPSYKFAPKTISHLGTAAIKGILKNQYGELAY